MAAMARAALEIIEAVAEAAAAVSAQVARSLLEAAPRRRSRTSISPITKPLVVTEATPVPHSFSPHSLVAAVWSTDGDINRAATGAGSAAAFTGIMVVSAAAVAAATVRG